MWLSAEELSRQRTRQGKGPEAGAVQCAGRKASVAEAVGAGWSSRT